MGMLGFVAVMVVWWLVAKRLARKQSESHDRMQRRIGWGYGYGAGYNDGQRGIYTPGAPEDGRARQQGRV